ADEEMPLDGLGPRAHPRQRHLTSILVKVTGIETPGPSAAPRRTHLVADVFEVVRMDEPGAVLADDFLRRVSEDGLRTRADLDRNPLGIGHQDQILRGLKDAAQLFGLLPQYLPRV